MGFQTMQGFVDAALPKQTRAACCDEDRLRGSWSRMPPQVGAGSAGKEAHRSLAPHRACATATGSSSLNADIAVQLENGHAAMGAHQSCALAVPSQVCLEM